MKYLLSALIFCAIIISSCGSDDVACDGTSFTSDLNAEISAVNAAGQTWANDPTQANCDNLKDAANSYLDAVEKYENCEGISQTEFQQALQQARDAVDDIPC